MSYPSNCEGNANQVQKVAAQTLVELEQPKKDKENWQVFRQIALRLHTSEVDSA